MEVGGRGGNTQRKANKTLFLPLERPESSGDVTCGGLELFLNEPGSSQVQAADLVQGY